MNWFTSGIFCIAVKLGELESAAVTFEKSLNLAKSQGKTSWIYLKDIFFFTFHVGVQFAEYYFMTTLPE